METQSQSLFAALGLPPRAIGGEPPKEPARMPPAPRDRREVLGLLVPRARNLFAGMPGRPVSLHKRPALGSANPVGQPVVVHFLEQPARELPDDPEVQEAYGLVLLVA